ncbi:MAG: hypothetical protein HXL34_06550 [Prevotellaceae bacterium]|nr:hypothetical protein [Prevotellaceae bacterium]
MVSMLTAYCTIIDGTMNGPLLCKGDCSAAVNSAYDKRRTMGVTAAVRAADGRRTMVKLK